MSHPGLPAVSRRRTSPWRAVLAVVVLIGTFGGNASTVAAAEPGGGVDATWTVKRPNGTTRTDGRIAIGDDLSMRFAALDGTPATQCRLSISTFDAYMLVPGDVSDGTCVFSMRLPAFPDPASRANVAGEPASDICVAATLFFDLQSTFDLVPADRLQPGGRDCSNDPGLDDRMLDFIVDDAGAAERTFTSDPPVVSWDPADWGTDMQPLRFGQPWRFALPDFVAACEPMLNGDWQTTIRPQPGPGCADWEVRVPGVLPSNIVFEGEAVWAGQLVANYHVEGSGLPYSVVSAMPVPIQPSDGVFESNLPAIFPVDLATTRFVTEGERWTPSFQVSGVEAADCRLTVYGQDLDDPEVEYHAVPTGTGLCTFDIPALGLHEHHQFQAVAHPVGEPDSFMITFGGSITGIEAPAPPIIDPPQPVTGGTDLDVDPGAGQGLVVDLAVTPASATAAETSTLAGAVAPVCTGRAESPDPASGGSIPTLEQRCALPPGSYVATATMVDAAGVAVSAQRSFVVVPRVVGRHPAPSSTKVARDIKPTVTFDVPVTGVAASTVRLRDVAAGTVVPSTVTYHAPTRKATISPSALLRTSRSYRVEVSPAIRSVTGMVPLAATTWTFVTTADGTKPTISARVPERDATGRSRTANVTVTFSEGVKGVNGSTLQLRDVTTGTYVPAVVTYDPTRRRARLDPTTTLQARRLYQVIVRSGIKDPAGNPQSTTSWTFRTGA